MPSFLSRVLGRSKKEDKQKSSSPTSSNPSLLGGKFERVSPTSAKFPASPASDAPKEKDKGGAFSLLTRIKSRDAGARLEEDRAEKRAPKLSLFLGPTSGQQTLSHELEAELRTMSDGEIGRSKLDPRQALALVQACSKGLSDRGLETLGIMHPHWYSSSPDSQRRLISFFLHTLVTNDPVVTSAATASFASEMSVMRSPHDIAAVLRWGIRHLELERLSFGEKEDWYNKFYLSEQEASYPRRAYTEKLAPLVQTPHFELLTALFDIVSSLASHSESNGISGSKMSKFTGLWLLTAQRASQDDDWTTFYDRWDKYGRMLEHLFLAYIRDEADKHPMPRRLTELIKNYPYTKAGAKNDDGLLSRPRFSTRRHYALHIQIATELAAHSTKPPRHPLLLISDAFKANTPDLDSNGAYTDVWENIRSAVAKDGGSLQQVFADETIRDLSMLPKLPGLDLSQLGFFFDRSASSPSKVEESLAPSSYVSPSNDGHGDNQRVSFDQPRPVTTSLGIDWNQFSTSGFLSSDTNPGMLSRTLLDKDVEVSSPPLTRTSSKLGRRTPSTQLSRSNTVQSQQPTSPGRIEAKYVVKVTPLDIVPVDEAFVDFWSDVILDPIVSNWPSFALCKVKSSIPGLDVEGKNVEYLIFERVYVTPPAPLLPPIHTTQVTGEASKTSRSPRAASPRTSLKNLSPSLKKRFSVWATPSSSKKTNGSPKVDEMGAVVDQTPKPSLDILREKDEASAAAAGPTTIAAISEETEAKAIATELPPSPKEALSVVDAASTPTIEEQHDILDVKSDGDVTEPIVDTVPAEATEDAPTENSISDPIPPTAVRAILADIPVEDSQPSADIAPVVSEPITPPSVDVVAPPDVSHELPVTQPGSSADVISKEPPRDEPTPPSAQVDDEVPTPVETYVEPSLPAEDVPASPVVAPAAVSEGIPEPQDISLPAAAVADPVTTDDAIVDAPADLASADLVPSDTTEPSAPRSISETDGLQVDVAPEVAAVPEIGEVAAPHVEDNSAVEAVPEVEDVVPEVEDVVPEVEDVVNEAAPTPEAEPALDIATSPVAADEPFENDNDHIEPIREPSPTPEEASVEIDPVPMAQTEVTPVSPEPVSPPVAIEPIREDAPTEEEQAVALAPVPVVAVESSSEPPAATSSSLSESVPQAIASAEDSVEALASAEDVEEAKAAPSLQDPLDSVEESLPSQSTDIAETVAAPVPVELEAVVDSGATPSPQALLDAVVQEPVVSDTPVPGEIEAVVESGSTPSPQALLDVVEQEPDATDAPNPTEVEALVESGSTPSPQALLDLVEQDPTAPVPDVIIEPESTQSTEAPLDAAAQEPDASVSTEAKPVIETGSIVVDAEPEVKDTEEVDVPQTPTTPLSPTTPTAASKSSKKKKKKKN